MPSPAPDEERPLPVLFKRWSNQLGLPLAMPVMAPEIEVVVRFWGRTNKNRGE